MLSAKRLPLRVSVGHGDNLSSSIDILINGKEAIEIP